MIGYVTTAAKAKEWGITQRRVDIYCKEGRIDGAELIGNRWLIPASATKPADPRKLKSERQEKQKNKANGDNCNEQ